MQSLLALERIGLFIHIVTITNLDYSSIEAATFSYTSSIVTSLKILFPFQYQLSTRVSET